MNDTIAEALGVSPLKETSSVIVAQPKRAEVVAVQDIPYDGEGGWNTDEDLVYARQHIRLAMRKAAKALDEAMLVAAASEHPRAYEVAGNLIKTLADVSESLVDLNKKKNEISAKPSDTPGSNVTNNNLILSTADMMKLLREGKI